QAQVNRTFVSGKGLDTNSCSLAAPCRTLAYALGQTNTRGEITILDTAGYGIVTITKSISIINDGVGEAGITTTTFNPAITITTGANDVVNLRGLTLVGGGVGGQGILFNGGGTLNLQNCVIRDFLGDSVALLPQLSATFAIQDTVVSNAVANAIEL